jgi:hypothetical protein
MKTMICRHAHWFAMAWCLVATAPASQAQQLTQSLTLRPGWNSVWIEVDPTNRSPGTVFGQTPIVSVWTWSERVSATDFIQNPDSTGWNRAQWLSYFPPGSDEARLANLYAVLPQRAYLVRVAGSNDVPWSVTGRPTLPRGNWVADRYNLRGFPVDPSRRPSFGHFFATSPAHRGAGGQLEAMFRLAPSGQWQRVAAGDLMNRGEAYWVFSRGASDFVAPVTVSLNSGEVADFAHARSRVDLTLFNARSTAAAVTIAPAGPNVSPLLLLPAISPGNTNLPRPLVVHTQTVAAAGGHRLSLGIDRAQLSNSPATNPATGQHANLLSVSDGLGTLHFVGVTAVTGGQTDLTGLWLGSITITNVSPTIGTTNGPGTPGPVARGFPLRMLLHIDAGGQASLLREVTLVTQRTNVVTGTNGVRTPVQTTELVTDPARLVQATATDLQDGTVRGRRFTSPHFDFTSAAGQFSVPLAGTFSLNGTLTGTLALPGDHPGNPFRHRYHPDHGTNAYAITRALELHLDSAAPSVSDQVYPTVTGTYAETLTGLHKLPLQVSGSLELRRISNVGVLNTPVLP